MVELLEGLASAAVSAYPALSLSVAYINGSSVDTIHKAGELVDTLSLIHISEPTRPY